ncbi:DUF2232 domain-containing protein [uncultured Enterovirga sp.]|uniref:DUF2232 domain-containing protein n=1 Tax=uncultured Enterovirga sp. TaxID=2026352 RepID=UPI0035C9D969
MIVYVALGLGAGLAAALLFAAAGTGSVSAVLLMYLAPLPILIVALGWHHLLGLLALSAGGIATSLLLRPSAGLAFALGPALSAWLLAWLALLRRPETSGQAGPSASDWYPVGHLLFCVGIGGALIGLASLAAATGWDYERYREVLEQTAGALLRREMRLDRSAPLPQPFGYPGADFVRLIVGIAPALLAGMLALILALNLWLAGRAVAISGRLQRPWPDVPSARMPMTALAGIAAAVVVAQLESFPGVAGTALAGGLLMAFALQGLALLHWVTRGRPARGLVLSLAYVLTLVLGYIFLPAFAVIGMVDTAFPLRRFLGGQPPPPPPTIT